MFGRELGFGRYEKVAEALGAHGEYAERPQDIRSALERAAKAVAGGKPAVTNVVTDLKRLPPLRYPRRGFLRCNWDPLLLSKAERMKHSNLLTVTTI